MKLFNSIAIVGIGLIGGSIALAAKKKKLCLKVIGVSRSARTLRLAKKTGVIDSGSLDINIIKEADLIILATPVRTILNLGAKIAQIIREEAVVTDAGSTKQEIVKRLDKIFPRFVGSHPLAGSEKSGIEYASSDIFKDTLCILTPTQKTDPAVLKKIKKFWLSLGARVDFLNPQTHDKVLSFVSHLPHLVAFSLLGAIPDEFLRFASSGLRDTTRIAASDPGLWSDIFFTNRKNIIKSIELFEKSLAKIKHTIERQDKTLLDGILRKAKEKREVL